jgi:serpin B
MAYTGASGRTREEMQRVLHLPDDDGAMLSGFSALQKELLALQSASQRRAEQTREHGGSEEPVEINVANRLFAQSGFAFRPTFTTSLRVQFGAPLDELDFNHAAEASRLTINAWVAHETREKVRDLVPVGAINAGTRAVLANAVYLRAPWEYPFEPSATRNEAFWVGGNLPATAPTMRREKHFGYEKRDGYAAVTLPYGDGELQFVILLPDRRDGLPDLEKAVTPAILAGCATLPHQDVILHLPKFKLEPPGLGLGATLRGLGMRTAFDQPQGSADFDRMAPRRPNDYLFISEVIHKAWLSLDEKGTEAAAATAMVMMAGSAIRLEAPAPIEVRVDRPFLFAIQDVASGTCLFLGRLTDPR